MVSLFTPDLQDGQKLKVSGHPDSVMYRTNIYKFFSNIFFFFDRFFLFLSNFSKMIFNNKIGKFMKSSESYVYRLYKYVADNNSSASKPDYLLLQIENLNLKTKVIFK